MDESRVVRAENPQSKEVFSTTNLRIALQTRLILGEEALNPDKTDLGKVTNDSLQDISQQTYGRLNTASTNERSSYWQEKSLGNANLSSFEAQMKSWTADLVKFVNEKNFTEKEALELYNRYFTGEGKASAIDRFVEDIIADLTQNENVNFEQLNQDLPKIKKMANIFGGNSSEIIEDLILTRAKLSDPAKKQELIEQVNEEKTIDQSPSLRINNLNDEEKRLLTWLSGNDQLEIEDKPVIQQSPLAERKVTFETQDVDFTVSYEQNRKATDQFIAILRDPKRLKPNPNNTLIHDYGFVFDKENGGVYVDTDLVARRYHLPVAIYTNYLIPNLPHANLVLRGPRLDQRDNRWKILIYNPYQLDIHEVVLDEVKTQEDALNAQKTKIDYNHLWKQEYLKNDEDISLTSDPELKTYQNILINAKLAPFQNDMINCLPYCYMVASMLNALKPGQTEFKTLGITQFLKDYQLKTLDRDEVLIGLRQHTQP